MSKTPAKPLSELEAEFKQVVDSVGEEIHAKLKQAAKLLREACDLSIQHGIPFYAPVSVLGQCFVPPSFEEKYERLDYNDVADLTGVPTDELQSAYGWKHSDVC